MTVAALLRTKGYDIASVAPTAIVTDIARELSTRRIGAILVRDSAGQMLGIVSERDITRCIAQHGAAALTKTAAQLMTTALLTVTSSTSVAEAMGLMSDSRVRHLPVVDNGALAGVISMGDVVKAKLSEQENDLDSLKAYVAGQ